MTTYIARRLLVLPIIVLGVTMLIFAMLSMLTPYERASLYVADVPKRQGSIEGIIEKYGLDDPVYIQYWHWMVGRKDPDTGEVRGGVLRGELGFSKTIGGPVLEVLRRRLPATAELAVWAAVPMIGMGILLGVLSAVHHNRIVDQVLRVFSIVGWSIPTFVFGLIVLMLFYAKLGWFPTGRLSDWASQIVQSDSYRQLTHMHTVDAVLNLRFDVFFDAMRHLVLPITTLAYLNWAYLLRVTRSSMLDVLREEYLTTARSKGLMERIVVMRHALPNALIPIITIGGLILVGLLNGVVITETIFNYPGLGQWAARAALNLDYASVLGFAVFTGIAVVTANLLVDVLYGVVDPRIRYN